MDSNTTNNTIIKPDIAADEPAISWDGSTLQHQNTSLAPRLMHFSTTVMRGVCINHLPPSYQHAEPTADSVTDALPGMLLHSFSASTQQPSPDNSVHSGCVSLAIEGDFKPTFNAEWSPDDEVAAQLFQAWDDLPRYKNQPWTPVKEKEVATRLEYLIPFFDAHIGHTDAGLRAFILRHQNAMQQGWSQPLPQYRESVSLTLYRWMEKKWILRYVYLAKLREQVIGHRLKMNLGLKGMHITRFWGERNEHPKRDMWTSSRVRKTSGVFREHWFMPVGPLLRHLSSRKKWESDEVYRQFWKLLPVNKTIEML